MIFSKKYIFLIFNQYCVFLTCLILGLNLPSLRRAVPDMVRWSIGRSVTAIRLSVYQTGFVYGPGAVRPTTERRKVGTVFDVRCSMFDLQIWAIWDRWRTRVQYRQYRPKTQSTWSRRGQNVHCQLTTGDGSLENESRGAFSWFVECFPPDHLCGCSPDSRAIAVLLDILPAFSIGFACTSIAVDGQSAEG